MILAHVLDGREDAPWLVLSGGLGTTTSMWDAQVASFGAAHRLLRVDHPGHGRSSVPTGSASVADVGAALVRLLDQFGAARVSFCGLSLGGMVGMWLAAEMPERVDRLVLACTGASLGARDVYLERAALVRRKGTDVVVAGARDRWFTPSFREEPAAVAVLDELRLVPREGYAACCEAVGSFDFHERLREIAAPTLVLHASEDSVTPPPVIDALLAGIPDVHAIELAGAAHLASVEQPEAFAAAVLDHVDERIAA